MEKGKPVDVRFYRDEERVLEYLWEVKDKGFSVLILPNPVKIPPKAWKEYTENRKQGKSALEVAVKYGVLKEENIAELRTIVLDLDSPYEEVRNLWDEFAETFRIEGYILERTKSGNFRAYLTLKPYLTPHGPAWYKPHEVHFNGHTHLQNLRETYGIWLSWWQKKGIKADTTFFFNLNHPVWYPEISVNGKVSKIEEVKEGYAGSLYNLYRKAKQVQSEQGLWRIKSGDKTINLTVYFWGNKLPYTSEGYEKLKERRTIKVPEFIKEIAGRKEEMQKQLDKKERNQKELQKDKLKVPYRQAVLSLGKKHNSYRFIHVMLPAVGWAKYLDLDESFVYDVLKEAIPDKNNFDRDFRIAWSKAWELEFNIPEGLKRKKNLRGLIAKLEKTKLRYWIERAKGLIRRKGEIYRQEILMRIFRGQKWLCDLVLGILEERGLVKFRFVKGKVGRPSKLIVWNGEPHKLKVSEFSHINNNFLAFSGSGEKPNRQKTSENVSYVQRTLKFAIRNKLQVIRKLYELYRYLSFNSSSFKLEELTRKLKPILKISKFRLSLMLYALEKAKLIRKIRRGRKGLEIELMPIEVLDELITKLLKAEVIYITELDERIRILEELKECRNGEGRRHEERAYDRAEERVEEKAEEKPEESMRSYKEAEEDISDEFLDF